MARTAPKSERRDTELGARFTAAQKKQVLKAAAMAGKRPSEFVREATLKQSEQTLAEDPLAAWGDFIGMFDDPDPRFTGKNAEELYGELLMEKYEKKKLSRLHWKSG